MDLTIQQGDLVFAVGRALGSVQQRSPQPILNCVLLEADSSGLRVTGTDMDVTTSVLVPCTVRTPGRSAVVARHFHEVVRKMPKGAVTLALGGNQCEVRYGDGKGWSRFPVQAADEFPRVPELKGGTTLTLEGDALARMVERTAYATSEEPARPQLNGVFVQGTDKQLAFVATDGHRLARSTRDGAFGELSKDGVIVPGRVFATVSKFAQEATSPVEMRVADGRNHAGFSTQVGEYRVQVFARLIEGPYPNYEQVIPRENDKMMTADKAALASALKRMSIVASDQTHRIRMGLANGSCKLSVQTPDLGEAQEELSVGYDGENLEIGFNAAYLLEIMKYMPTDEVRMTFKGPERAATCEPVGWNDPAAYLTLVMPLRLVD